MIKDYYNLTKPGIIYGNALMAAGAFLLASRQHIDFGLLLAMLAGISLVIASACIFNNYLDRNIDAKMVRTQKRAIVSGAISAHNALLYAAALGLTGFLLLIQLTNPLTALIALMAFVTYIVLYGIAKRLSVHGTLVGSLAGAAPPVVGYTTVTNQFDGGALILFLILVCWQMPHFYAISIYRLADYKAAGIPVLPAVKGYQAARVQIVFYIAAFIAAVNTLTISGNTGYVFAAVMTIMGLMWLYRGLLGFQAPSQEKWARSMFGFSVIVIICLSMMLSFNSILP